MSKGYGSFGFGPPRGRTALAPRVSWFIHYGVMPEQWVLHHCDTPRCVRPDHLYLGTVKDNTRDMWQRGRQVLPTRPPTPEERARGSRSGPSKLTEEQVAEIRKRYGPPRGRGAYGQPRISQGTLAKEYGVDQTIISDIVRRETWQHVS